MEEWQRNIILSKNNSLIVQGIKALEIKIEKAFSTGLYSQQKSIVFTNIGYII